MRDVKAKEDGGFRMAARRAGADPQRVVDEAPSIAPQFQPQRGLVREDVGARAR
jgi:hypothetical protein